MPDDQAQAILSPAQADNSVKADAWQAFKDSANEREYGVRLQGMNLPQDVKAQLWEAKRKAGPSVSPEQKAIASAPNAPLQAKQQVMANIKPVIPGTAMVDPTGGGMAAAQAGQNPAYNDYMHQSGALAGTVGGGMVTGGLLPAVKGAGLAANALRLGGRAVLSGAGAGIGSLAGGATSHEAGVNAIGGAVGQPIAEGVVGAVSPFVKWLTASKTAGATALQQAASKAGSAPVELSAKTNELVDKLVEQSKLGGKPIKVISDLLERVGPSTKQAAEAVPGPLTYNEARILQGNISSLSAEEQLGLKGAQKGLMKQLAGSFSTDVQKAADAAGVGEEHAFGMKQYATASARNRTLIKAGKLAGIGAGTAGTAYELARLAGGAR